MAEGPKKPDNFQKQFEETNSEMEKEERKLDTFRKEIRELARKHPNYFKEDFTESDLGYEDMRVYRLFQQGGRALLFSDLAERYNQLKDSSASTEGSKMLSEYMYETMRDRLLQI